VRIARFRAAGQTRWGVLETSHLVEYLGSPFGAFRRGRRRYAVSQVVLLPPVVPSKIVLVGLNYRDHAVELGLAIPDEPIILFKPPSALAGPGDAIVCPPQSRRVDHEAELAVVIKRRCRNVSAARAHEYVLGYTCLNDVTARDLQTKDVQWARAKAFDTFCPLGPCIATDLDAGVATVEAWVNDTLRQSASTRDMIFPLEEVVARVSEVMTLLPGDVISTGTPPGVGPLYPGDHVEVRIPGIGSLRNPVVGL
jgi:2-keto-4-pentenoate hydratase/2-oxohepta-3-ene-1,7-dioic acid hydratase in catechol pathway